MMAQGLQADNSTLNRLRRHSKILDIIITKLSQIWSKLSEGILSVLDKFKEILTEFLEKLTDIFKEFMQLLSKLGFEELEGKILEILEKISSSKGLLGKIFSSGGKTQERIMTFIFKEEKEIEAILLVEEFKNLFIAGGAIFFAFVVPVSGGTKRSYTFKNSRKDAIVASSGSLFNLIVGILVLLISLIFNSKWFALAGAFPNLALCTFCLFHFSPFEGKRVFFGSKIVWGLLFFTSVLLYLYTVLSF